MATGLLALPNELFVCIAQRLVRESVFTGDDAATLAEVGDVTAMAGTNVRVRGVLLGVARTAALVARAPRVAEARALWGEIHAVHQTTQDVLGAHPFDPARAAAEFSAIGDTLRGKLETAKFTPAHVSVVVHREPVHAEDVLVFAWGFAAAGRPKAAVACAKMAHVAEWRRMPEGAVAPLQGALPKLVHSIARQYTSASDAVYDAIHALVRVLDCICDEAAKTACSGLWNTHPTRKVRGAVHWFCVNRACWAIMGVVGVGESPLFSLPNAERLSRFIFARNGGVAFHRLDGIHERGIGRAPILFDPSALLEGMRGVPGPGRHRVACAIVESGHPRDRQALFDLIGRVTGTELDADQVAAEPHALEKAVDML